MKHTLLILFLVLSCYGISKAQNDKIFIPDGGTSIFLGNSDLVAFGGGGVVAANMLEFDDTLYLRGDFQGMYKLKRAVVFGNGSMVTDAGTQLQITQGLKVQGGSTFNANGETVILSTVAGTGNVEELSATDAITNEVIMQRYIPGGRRSYRMMSHPFVENKTITETVQDDFDVTGTGGATNGFVVTQTNSPSAYYFDAALGDANLVTNNAGWKPFTSANTQTWTRYRAANLMIRGAKNEGLLGQLYVPSIVTVDFQGVINQQNQTINLTTGIANATHSFNIVGNPYPSDLQLNRAVNAMSNFRGGGYWVWETNTTTGFTNQNQLPSYGKWAPVLKNAITLLPSSSAFMVNVDAATSITFLESDKIVTNSPYPGLFKTTTGPELVEFQLYSDTGMYKWDKMYVMLDANASDSVDAFDAAKPFVGDVNFYGYAIGGQQQSILAFPWLLGKVVPLGMKCSQQRNFQLKATDHTLDPTHPVYLHDKYLNTLTLLQPNTTYSFTTTTDTNTHLHRFELGMGAIPLSISLLRFSGQSQEGGNMLSWTTDKEAAGDRFELQRSANGDDFATIYRTSAKATASDYNHLDEQPIEGNNYYRLRLTDANGAFSYSQVVLLGNKRGREISWRLYPNPATDAITIGANAPLTDVALLTVIDMSGKTVLTTSMDQGKDQVQLDCSRLSAGVYQVICTTSGGKRKVLDFVKQ